MRVPAFRDRLNPLTRLARRSVLVLVVVTAGSAMALPVADRRPVAADGELRLRMDAGRLIARPGTEPAVVVEADLPPGMALRWREVRGGWVLVLDDRERLLPREARVTLSVPAGLRLRIDAGDAEVDLEGVGGAGLVVRGGRSPVRIAASGPVPVVAETLGGDLRLELERPGRVRAETLGGRLEVNATGLADADLRLETLSGDLALRVPAGGPVTVRPRLASGTLTLPASAKATPEGFVQLGEGGGQVAVASLTGHAALIEDPGLAAPAAAPAPASPPAPTPPAAPPAPPPGG